jgi:tetratricopeptide (TPR) repeat protein
MHSWFGHGRLVAVVALALSISPRAQSLSVSEQLDRYLRGDYQSVVTDLAARENLDDVLEGLKRDAPAWIEAGGPAEKSKRVLTAATVALEAGRAGAFMEWKWVQRWTVTAPDAAGDPYIQIDTTNVYWKTPPLLLEWGCALLRAQPTPHPDELNWQLAAVAAAQLAGDSEFMVGSPYQARHNPKDEIDHLKHVIARFPKEPRFALAQAIAVEWTTYPNPRRTRKERPRVSNAVDAFDGMTRDEGIGPEATLRLGVLRLREGTTAAALDLFKKVQNVTRDPYLIYLATFHSGQAHQSANRSVEAERAYRTALKVVPNAQSAAIALAALLFRTDRPAEAARITESSLSAQPQPADPWREYGAADNRFWPELVGRLRAAIVKVNDR